jgi:hypothetical protein
VQDLLDYVISVDILAHLFDSVPVEVLEDLEVRGKGYYFNDLLNRPCAMRIHAELDWFRAHSIDYLRQLVSRTFFSQSLDEIVSKAVIHKGPSMHNRVVVDLIQHFLVVGIFCLLDVLLKKSAASLILG